MEQWLLTILTIVAGSSLLATFASNWQQARLERKKIVASATLSASVTSVLTSFTVPSHEIITDIKEFEL